MNKLRVWFCNVWPEFKDENIFLPILQKHFEVEINESEPDLVIHSVFGGTAEAQKFKCKKLLFIGENYRAKNYGSDYSISFDPHSDTNYYLPLWQFYLILMPELQDHLFNKNDPNRETFERFCSFTVSNPNNFYRNGFYDQLNAYKRVHSYGRSLTNDFGLQRASQGNYWRITKYKFFTDYSHKFTITFEHSSYPGYVTEKLMDGFLGQSIPIYWGSPTIEKEFNAKAFINVMKEKDAIGLIKKIDNDDELFKAYFNEPAFTEEQKQRHIENMENFESWLINICNK